MRYKPMPCTPAGDVVCQVTEGMGVEEAKALILRKVKEYEKVSKVSDLKREIDSEERLIAAAEARLKILKEYLAKEEEE
jgi:hypothetical protein